MEAKLSSLAGLVSVVMLSMGTAANATTVTFVPPPLGPTLDPNSSPATVTGNVGACTVSPCRGVNEQTATFTDVPVTSFGTNQNVQTFAPGKPPTSSTANTPGVVSVGGAGQVAAVAVTGAPLPTIRAQAAENGGSAVAQGTLTYFFEVTRQGGGSTSNPVSVMINSIGSVSSTTSGGGQFATVDAQFLIPNAPIAINEQANIAYSGTSNNSSTGGVGFVSGTLNPVGTTSMSGGFDLSQSFMLSTDLVYEVELAVSVSLGTNAINDGSASASIDPMIFLPSGFQLDLSDGIGNGSVATTPLPPTWTMMLAALVGFGFIGLRGTRDGAAGIAAA